MLEFPQEMCGEDHGRYCNVNADAGAVTVIPPESLTAIVKSSNFIAGANVTLADVQHLQVTNAQPITGGGTQSVHAVQQADLDAAKATVAEHAHDLSALGFAGNV